jgi:hypothetical protein
LSYNGYRLVLLLGIISMLGDFVYEGGRSVLPDYMRQLGLDAVAVGSALGFAEFMGLGRRDRLEGLSPTELVDTTSWSNSATVG